MIDLDCRLTLITVLIDDIHQLATNDHTQTLGISQDIQVIFDLLEDLTVLFNDLVLLKPGQAMQAKIKNGLSLHFGELVTTIMQAKFLTQIIRLGSFSAGTLKHATDDTRLPGLRNQLFLGLLRILRFLDQLDDWIDVRQCNRKTFQYMGTFSRFTQQINRTPCDDFTPMANKRNQHIMKIEKLWLPFIKRNHIDAEDHLQLCLLVQLVKHDIARLATSQFDNNAHTIFI